MCGLAGFLVHPARARPASERRAILRAMGRQLALRGPDDEQIHDDGVLSLVFRRLAIVDVASGRQPLWDERRSAFACVNGEIWNHKALRAALAGRHDFATSSDAEVVVHLYEDLGADLLPRLDGMFGLAVWDAAARRLLLARDRFGVKPMYYAKTDDGLLFGSELKALLVHPDCPSHLAFGDLDLGHLATDAYATAPSGRVPSYVEGVEVLRAGTFIEVAPGDARIVPRTYWSLLPAIERSIEAPPRPPASYVEEVSAALVEAVRGQLMSDVPVGAFLSGGLDSSALVAIAAREGHALPCFSVVEKTTVDAGDVERARLLTRSLGLSFHPVAYEHEGFAERVGFSLEALEYYVWMMDAPRFAPELFFKHELHRYAKTVDPGLKVMILGQGADEFSGGYSAPAGTSTPGWAAYAARLDAVHDAEALSMHGIPPQLRALVRGEVLAGPPRAPYHREMLARTVSLQTHNLWVEDRIAAAQGIEARVPYLDHRLVEALAAIPPTLHPELFWDKAILRAATAPFVPDEIRLAPKVPFWLGADPSSVHRIMIDCVRRAFPAFREAYLDRPDSLFSAPALITLYARTRPRSPDRVQAAKLLLACMTTAIFARLCRDLRAGAFAVRPIVPPSPLTEVRTP